MRPIKRSFLKIILINTGLWLILSKVNYSFSKNSLPDKVTLTFQHFLDTLIPQDVSPSASQINLDGELLNYAKNIKNYEQLIYLGCQWLDLQSRAFYKMEFVQLNSNQKDKIIEFASRNRHDTIPAQFFNRLRHDAFMLYYAKPESWLGLSFSRPPQPLGYLNYQERP